MLKYSIKTPSGERELSSKDLLNQYASFTGFQPIGMSNDGSSGIYQTPQGIQTIPFHEAIQSVGGTIGSYRPENAIPSENVMKYRLALENISDPDVQKAYFTTVANRDYGLDNPLIIRDGSDTFLWNQREGNWVNLTNEQGLGLSDIAGTGLGLAKGALSVGGGIAGGVGAGALGLPSGPGAIAALAAGTAGGSALGSLGADALGAGVMSLTDPAFAQNYQASKEIVPALKRAALSGAVGAAGPLLGAAAPGLKALRPSSMATGLGQGTQAVGKGISAAGRGLDTELGRMGMQMGLDPTGLSGIGALGGVAKDFAPKMAEGAASAATTVRNVWNAIRNNPIAQEPVKMQGLQDFARGVGALGSGLEKVGRGVENTIIGAAKGTGAALQGTGLALRGTGYGLRALEQPALQYGIKSAAESPYGWRVNEVPGTFALDSPSGPAGETLQEAIAARGGIYNVLNSK